MEELHMANTTRNNEKLETGIEPVKECETCINYDNAIPKLYRLWTWIKQLEVKKWTH